MTKQVKENTSYLGDYVIPKTSFKELKEDIKKFKSSDFLKFSEYERTQKINETLLHLILNSSKEQFLLPAIIEYIEFINEEGILSESYHITNFEFWLNHFSSLSDTDNYFVRSKIAGKFIPRDEYQAFFPIGMNKTFNGTHFVTAHLSPDVDTMVASFWGWLDAFSARVGNARHIWGLPGGPPDSPVTRVFQDFFGFSVFKNVANTSGALTLTATDLISQKGFIKKTGEASLSELEGSGEKAIVLVDEKGKFLGDWHNQDTVPVRKIIIRFKSCLRWFENNLHVQLISLFAKKHLNIKDLKPFLSSVFDVTLEDCEPAKEFTDRQKKDLNEFFLKVFNLEKGLKSTYRELNRALLVMSMSDLYNFEKELTALETIGLFDVSGHLIEDRPIIFNRLEKIINQLDKAIQSVRDYVEQFDIALKIKNLVFNIPSDFITMRSDVEDIRLKMKGKDYLPVVVIDNVNQLFPVGIVWNNSLQQQTLGTISFRDFCNQEEVRMASYLTPISVVDHHKTSLKTSSPPLAIIGDAQSCNVLLAELAFSVYSRYSTGGMSELEIEKQIDDIRHHTTTSENVRILQRLLQKKTALKSNPYFIQPERELIEYICYLHAILDDTDLLTKVSKRDVECVVELLNRIKSLTIKKDVEIINLDDIPKDKDFAKNAAKKILRNQEMFSFYKKIYESKEREIEDSLTASQAQHFESLFLDTKVQNTCCRVGQTKLFSINFNTFEKNSQKILSFFAKQAEEISKENPEIDLHLHMVSTIASAEEVHNDKVGHYHHQDELWFYAPSSQRGFDHLSNFLTAFQVLQKLGPTAKICFLPSASAEIQKLFIQNCPGLTFETLKGPDLPVIIIRFPPGLLNSRKAMITPYLPRSI